MAPTDDLFLTMWYSDDNWPPLFFIVPTIPSQELLQTFVAWPTVHCFSFWLKPTCLLLEKHIFSCCLRSWATTLIPYFQSISKFCWHNVQIISITGPFLSAQLPLPLTWVISRTSLLVSWLPKLSSL